MITLYGMQKKFEETILCVLFTKALDLKWFTSLGSKDVALVILFNIIARVSTFAPIFFVILPECPAQP